MSHLIYYDLSAAVVLQNVICLFIHQSDLVWRLLNEPHSVACTNIWFSPGVAQLDPQLWPVYSAPLSPGTCSCLPGWRSPLPSWHLLRMRTTVCDTARRSCVSSRCLYRQSPCKHRHQLLTNPWWWRHVPVSCSSVQTASGFKPCRETCKWDVHGHANNLCKRNHNAVTQVWQIPMILLILVMLSKLISCVYFCTYCRKLSRHFACMSKPRHFNRTGNFQPVICS